MSFFTEDLLTSIKLRSLAPISQSTFSDTNLLSLASEEMRLGLVADLIGDREDFFLATESQNVTANLPNYPIPSRAIGTAVKQVVYINSTFKQPLQRVDVDQSPQYSQTGPSPDEFYLLGDEIILLPTPSLTSGTLEITFPATPNDLIATTSCAAVTVVTNGATYAVFTVNTDLSASLAVGAYVDFLSVTPPFRLLKYRAAITAITSTTISVLLSDIVNGASVNRVSVGDYICPTGFSNIPQIPLPYQPILAQMVVVRLMESLGDAAKLAASKATLAEMRSDALKLVRNRVENSLKRITGTNQLIKYLR